MISSKLTLPDGRVWLLGFNTELFDDNALGVGGTHERVGLQVSKGVRLGVVEIFPLGSSTLGTELPGSLDTHRFTHGSVKVPIDG